jgi:hypothetical protein
VCHDWHGQPLQFAPTRERAEEHQVQQDRGEYRCAKPLTITHALRHGSSDPRPQAVTER